MRTVCRSCGSSFNVACRSASSGLRFSAAGCVLSASAAARRTAPLESTLAVTTIDDDAVLLGALDAGLTAVREALITAIRDS